MVFVLANRTCFIMGREMVGSGGKGRWKTRRLKYFWVRHRYMLSPEPVTHKGIEALSE